MSSVKADLELYKAGSGGGGYLMFVGRMSPDKGVPAVRVAKNAGKQLVLATKRREDNHIAYFESEVKPRLDLGDEMPAEIPQDRRIELLRRADAMLNPITWREPFGLVMAEALACATPVLAFPNGAAPEIIEPGRTGFLCRDEGEMIRAIDRVGEIDRSQRPDGVSVFVMKVTSATQFGDRVLATGRVGSQSLRVRVGGAQGRDVREGIEVLVGWRQCDLHVIPESPAA